MQALYQRAIYAAHGINILGPCLQFCAYFSTLSFLYQIVGFLRWQCSQLLSLFFHSYFPQDNLPWISPNALSQECAQPQSMAFSIVSKASLLMSSATLSQQSESGTQGLSERAQSVLPRLSYECWQETLRVLSFSSLSQLSLSLQISLNKRTGWRLLGRAPAFLVGQC